MPQLQHAHVVAVLTQGGGILQDDPPQSLELMAFLTPDAHLDLANRRLEPPVRRLRAGDEIWAGSLVPLDQEEGASARWALRSAKGEDGPLWGLTVQRLRPGEHVTLHAPDGATLVFRVVNVTVVQD
jgi:hypothetical protein